MLVGRINFFIGTGRKCLLPKSESCWISYFLHLDVLSYSEYLLNVPLKSVTLDAYISNAVNGFLQSSDPKWCNVTFFLFFLFQASSKSDTLCAICDPARMYRKRDTNESCQWVYLALLKNNCFLCMLLFLWFTGL